MSFYEILFAREEELEKDPIATLFKTASDWSARKSDASYTLSSKNYVACYHCWELNIGHDLDMKSMNAVE